MVLGKGIWDVKDEGRWLMGSLKVASRIDAVGVNQATLQPRHFPQKPTTSQPTGPGIWRGIWRLISKALNAIDASSRFVTQSINTTRPTVNIVNID